MKKAGLLAAVMMSLLLAGCSNPVKEGTALLEEKKYEEAAETFQETIDKDKNLGEAYRGQGIAYWELEDYEASRDCFMKAIDHGTEKTGTIFNMLGICNMKLDQMEDALNYFNLGLAMENNDKTLIREMKYNEIVAYESMKDWENAKVKIADYIVQYPEDEKAAKEAEFLETR